MNTRLKVALTHDVDRTVKTYQYCSHFFRALKNKNFEEAIYQITSLNQRAKVYWNFEEIIELENKYGVKSTFFFLIESIPFKLFDISNWKLSLGRYDIQEPRIVAIIRYLDENGWEIGLHGSFRSYFEINLLKKEKILLENQLAHSIIGIRQHYLNLNQNTWLLQRDAGFNYDTSWGFNDEVGFKDNRIKPFRPFDDKFIVFPLVIMDSCYINSPNQKKNLQDIINICIENNGILVINWHSNNFNEREYPGYKKAYCEIIESCLDHNALFNTLNYFYKKL